MVRVKIKNPSILGSFSVFVLFFILTGCATMIPAPRPPMFPAPPDPPRTNTQTIEQAVNTDPILNFNPIPPLPDLPKRTFAVMDFLSKKEGEGASVLVADTFYISLSNRGLKIIERERIRRIAEEQDLLMREGRRSITEEEKAQRIGKLVGADYIIFGAVTEYETQNRDVNLGSFIPPKERDRYAADFQEFQRKAQEYNEAYQRYLKEVENYNMTQAVLLSGHRIYLGQTPRVERVKTLEEWEDETARVIRRTALATVANIGMTARVIDVRTGQIVWVAQGAKRHTQLHEGLQFLVDTLVDKFLTQAIAPRK